MFDLFFVPIFVILTPVRGGVNAIAIAIFPCLPKYLQVLVSQHVPNVSVILYSV